MLAVQRVSGMSPSEQRADERALVQRCQQGDEGAMRQLYLRHAGRLLGLAQRMLGDRAEAEDVVQECFLRAWRSLDRFRGDAAFGTWLYRIAINLCRDRARRRAPTPSLLEPGEAWQAPDVLAREQLERALRALPVGYREVLLLHDVMELDHGEIAEVLGVARGTSKSQLHKARLKMRGLLRGTTTAVDAGARGA